MRCVVCVILLCLGGCFTVVGTSVGTVWGVRYNEKVDRENRNTRLERFAALSPSARADEQRACEEQHKQQALELTRTTGAYERYRLQVAMRTCDYDRLLPNPQPHGSVGAHAVLGLLVGAAVDVSLVGLLVWSCNRSQQPGECL